MEAVPALAGGCNKVIFKVYSNPNHSVVLCLLQFLFSHHVLTYWVCRKMKCDVIQHQMLEEWPRLLSAGAGCSVYLQLSQLTSMPAWHTAAHLPAAQQTAQAETSLRRAMQGHRPACQTQGTTLRSQMGLSGLIASSLNHMYV